MFVFLACIFVFVYLPFVFVFYIFVVGAGGLACHACPGCFYLDSSQLATILVSQISSYPDPVFISRPSSKIV